MSVGSALISGLKVTNDSLFTLLMRAEIMGGGQLAKLNILIRGLLWEKTKNYSTKFKTEATKGTEDNNENVSKTARSFGISMRTLLNWQ